MKIIVEKRHGMNSVTKDVGKCFSFFLHAVYFVFTAFTLLQVDVYRRRLRERERRKCLLKDHGVIQSSTSAGSKKLQVIRAKQSKDERSAMMFI